MSPAKDIADLRNQTGTAKMLETMKEKVRPFIERPQEQAPASILPPIVTARDLFTKNPKEPPQIINKILHQGSKMVLGGGSKSYKTWSLLDLGMSVACGEVWWGFKTEKSRVLYVNLELPDWSIKGRIEAIRAERAELTDLGCFDVWNLRGHAVSFEKMRPEMTRVIQKNYGLIIIDPIYKVYGGRDENSAGEMGELLNEIERLAVETGSAVVFGAHFSKGNQSGKESIDRISGSGVFARDPDSILIMTKHERPDTFTVESTLRNLQPVASFCVERCHPLMVRNDALDPSSLLQPTFKKKYTVEQLMAVLGSSKLTASEWEERTIKETGMSRRTFMDKLRLLKKDGAVELKEEKYTAKAKPGKEEAELSAGATGAIAPTALAPRS